KGNMLKIHLILRFIQRQRPLPEGGMQHRFDPIIPIDFTRFKKHWFTSSRENPPSGTEPSQGAAARVAGRQLPEATSPPRIPRALHKYITPRPFLPFQ